MWSTEAQVKQRAGIARERYASPTTTDQRGAYGRWEQWNHKPDLPAMGVLEMNARELYDRADSIAENAFLKLVSRISMGLAAPIVAVGITWFGSTLWTINNSQGELAGKIALLAQQINQLSEGKYTVNDANRDAKAQTVKDNEQDRRINSLETKFERLQPLQQLPR